ncbi:MAG: peptidylprolyl isomerase [Planctomycetota bacterium]|nr:peptidylprolyl isomerase [Planctomycetota bacterium]
MTAAEFQHDMAPFISEPGHVREAISSLLVWLQQTSDHDAEAMVQLAETHMKGKDGQPFNIRPILAKIRSQSDKAPEDLLNSIIPVVWEGGLKSWVEADLRRLAESSEQEILPVACHIIGVTPLTGSSVIATVNGKPIFVDDILGGARRRIEVDPNLSDEQRQIILLSSLRARTRGYTEDELVVQAMEATIPEDKRKLIRDSLEPAFQEVCQKMMKDQKMTLDDELDRWLEGQGFTRREMKDAFIRRQSVVGYVQSNIQAPSQIDRKPLVKYYEAYIEDHAHGEEVRFAEIVVRFSEHDGPAGADEIMNQVLERLQQEEDFGTLAGELSDALSGEKCGDIGWIKRGSLVDKDLEEMLFDMPAGTMSSVKSYRDRLEVYKVTDRRDAKGIDEFEAVQQDIENKLLADLRNAAKKRFMDSLRDEGKIVTIFDAEKPAEELGHQ